MEIINEYNILSDISNIDKKIYQPFYSTTNVKIFHNKNEILLMYDKKENMYVNKSDKNSKYDKNSKSDKNSKYDKNSKKKY